MQLTISRSEAKAMGYTHEGYAYGAPVYLRDFNEEEDLLILHAKFLPLTYYIRAMDWLFEAGCLVFWRVISPDLVFKAPMSLKGPI